MYVNRYATADDVLNIPIGSLVIKFFNMLIDSFNQQIRISW